MMFARTAIIHASPADESARERWNPIRDPSLSIRQNHSGGSTGHCGNLKPWFPKRILPGMSQPHLWEAR